MAFDVTGALVMGVIGYLLLRERSGMNLFALTFGLFGFFLAGTGLHDGINTALHSIVSAITQFISTHVH